MLHLNLNSTAHPPLCFAACSQFGSGALLPCKVFTCAMLIAPPLFSGATFRFLQQSEIESVTAQFALMRHQARQGGSLSIYSENNKGLLTFCASLYRPVSLGQM